MTVWIVTAWLTGDRKPRRWTYPRDFEAERAIHDLLARGFDELSADRLRRIYYPVHRIARVEVEESEDDTAGTPGGAS